ncbi:putative hemolysin [Chitinivorax tropicus]|uniref:Putative hemolysin n=1 Tax=Chitinivorax tropicus TaxID=714531 RepID=A0A840MLQ9_9PROT|nr:hemolysin family protein [Chitinivorax tropicus]MBB5017837.1 putative hemolysin [Chitinivorax tropicus]
MEYLILLGLIVLNGVFAMSEIALVTARKARLMKLASEGDSAAQIALKLGEDPTRFLSTVQIGITSISILNGIVGEAVLAAPFAQWLQSLGLPERAASIGATAVVVLVVTYVSIVIGELVPKRLGQISPEPIARLVARPMQALATLTRPFVMLLSLSTQTLLQLMGVRQDRNQQVTEEEIHAILDEGNEAGVIEQNQHAMVRNVFRLDERKLASLMIPRADIVFVDLQLPPEENLRRLVESEHSRFPVCDGQFDHLLGVIHAKQVLAYTATGQAPDFGHNLQPAVYVPETLTGMELLEQFRTSNMQIAFVVDEYGEIIGMATLRDLLEAVTGEFASHNADDAWAVQREDGSWLLDGAIPILDMKDKLELRHVPEEDRGQYHMLSGMVMLLLGRVPRTGDHADWEGWRFEVVDMDGKRIDKVLATPLADDEPEATPDSPAM